MEPQQHQTSTGGDHSVSLLCVTQSESTACHDPSAVVETTLDEDPTKNQESYDDESHLFPLEGNDKIEIEETENLAKSYYIANGKAPQVILSMHIGIPTLIENVEILHMDDSFFSPLKKKDYYPKIKHLIAEIHRRWKLYPCKERLTGAPCPNQWKRDKIIKFLMDNPIPKGSSDRIWVEEEINYMSNHIKSMKLEKQTAKEQSSLGTSWTNHKPYLRLYHTLNDEGVRERLLKQFDSKDCYKIDGRNSVVRDMDFYEFAADKFNSAFWVPTSLRLPHLHPDFSEPIELPMKYHPIDAKTVKKRIGIARAQMVMVISRWEQSGNGAAMVDNDYPETEEENVAVNLDEVVVNLKDGDDRSNFLISEKPHVLYLWEICQQNGVLSVLRQQMSEEVKGSGESTNLTSYSSYKKSKPKSQGIESEKFIQTSKENNQNMVSTLVRVTNVNVNSRKYEIRMGYALQRRMELENHIKDVKQSLIQLNDRQYTAEKEQSSAETDNLREISKRQCNELQTNRDLMEEELNLLRKKLEETEKEIADNNQKLDDVVLLDAPGRKNKQKANSSPKESFTSASSIERDKRRRECVPSLIKAQRSQSANMGNYHMENEYFTSSSSDLA